MTVEEQKPLEDLGLFTLSDKTIVKKSNMKYRDDEFMTISNSYGSVGLTEDEVRELWRVIGSINK